MQGIPASLLIFVGYKLGLTQTVQLKKAKPAQCRTNLDQTLARWPTSTLADVHEFWLQGLNEFLVYGTFVNLHGLWKLSPFPSPSGKIDKKPRLIATEGNGKGDCPPYISVIFSPWTGNPASAPPWSERITQTRKNRTQSNVVLENFKTHQKQCWWSLIGICTHTHTLDVLRYMYILTGSFTFTQKSPSNSPPLPLW